MSREIGPSDSDLADGGSLQRRSAIHPTRLPVLLVCAGTLAAWPGALRAQAPTGGTGRIEGVASRAARLTGPRQRVRVYGESGTPVARGPDQAHEFSNVVLYLESTDALRAASRPGSSASMALRHERFVPHVLPIITGTEVAFPNDDALYHSVFSLSRARTLDLGRYPYGESKSVRFTSPGVVQVFCHIHADMSAYILVLDHPFFAMPDADGHFTLDGVPAGDYDLVGWHERGRPVRVPVRVEAGRITNARIAIPISDNDASP